MNFDNSLKNTLGVFLHQDPPISNLHGTKSKGMEGIFSATRFLGGWRKQKTFPRIQRIFHWLQYR